MEEAARGFVIGILICQIVVSIVLAAIFLIRPSVTTGAAWKIQAFIGLRVLPALCIVGGMNTHVQRSEQTKFCISCHVKIPYGATTLIGLGVLVYVVPLVFVAEPPAGPHSSRQRPDWRLPSPSEPGLRLVRLPHDLNQ